MIINESLITIENVKDFAKIDADDNKLIESLIESAKIYMKNAGIEVMEQNNLYLLAISQLVLHWHDNREIVGKADKMAFSLESIILQLKYCDRE